MISFKNVFLVHHCTRDFGFDRRCRALNTFRLHFALFLAALKTGSAVESAEASSRGMDGGIR